MRDGSHDFDYLAGSWNVHHERLRQPLSGSTDWYSFGGTMAAALYWGGGANIDDNVLNMPDATIKAFSIRLYDATTQNWSIYWATSVYGLTTLPTVGALQVVGHNGECVSVGTIVLAGRRCDVGGELANGFHARLSAAAGTKTSRFSLRVRRRQKP